MRRNWASIGRVLGDVENLSFVVTAIGGLLPMMYALEIDFWNRSVTIGSVNAMMWIQISTAIILGGGASYGQGVNTPYSFHPIAIPAADAYPDNLIPVELTLSTFYRLMQRGIEMKKYSTLVSSALVVLTVLAGIPARADNIMTITPTAATVRTATGLPCGSVVVTALICGAIRGIPVWCCA